MAFQVIGETREGTVSTGLRLLHEAVAASGSDGCRFASHFLFY